MDEVIERFNRLQERFGRLVITDISDGIWFKLSHRHYWLFDESVREVVDGQCESTPFSRWVDAISKGGVRDDSGVVSNGV